MESATKKLSERVQLRDDANIIVVDGVSMSGELLSLFTQSTPPGIWFRLECNGDAVTYTQKVERP